jgi:hypothetical protein
MAITERIQQYVQRLPTAFQTEVLDFVEYLVTKAERNTGREEEQDWSALSLTLAMRGMEDDNVPTYTTADLKVVFS